VVPVSGPTVGKRRLRAELRVLRQDRQLTQEQVATDMEWSLSKLIRIENGTVAISVSDLRSLLAYYAVHDQQRINALLELARAAKRRMWWDEYRSEMPTSLLTYVGFESEATEIGTFHPIVLPGLVQTEGYARALFAGLGPDLDHKEVERRVEFRMRRQEEVFNRQDPPRFIAVLDESVLYRQPDANEETMREQLTHLIEFAQRPHVELRVLPYNAGVHRGWDGNFTVMGFGGDDRVYYSQNNPSGDVLLWEEQDVVNSFYQVLRQLLDRALSPDESLAFIQRRLDEVKPH
jgi:transcriptional regulator with XRE-family HTH domain